MLRLGGYLKPFMLFRKREGLLRKKAGTSTKREEIRFKE